MQKQMFNNKGDSDIYFDYIENHQQETMTDIDVSCPVILFVYSGLLTIQHKSGKTSLKKGECVFIQANIKVTFSSKDEGEAPFCGIYIGFNKSFLSEFYSNYFDKEYRTWGNGLLSDVLKIPCTPYMESLYISMIPYWEQKIRPEEDILSLKRKECIHCMLTTDPRFHQSLFDFIKPIEQNFFYVIQTSNLNYN